MKQTDFSLVDHLFDKLLGSESLSLEEQELVASGEHPHVGLFLQEVGLPIVRTRRDVRRGTILGQFATIVRPQWLCEPHEDTIEGTLRACLAFNVDIRLKGAVEELTCDIDSPNIMLSPPSPSVKQEHEPDVIFSKPVPGSLAPCLSRVCTHKKDAMFSAQDMHNHIVESVFPLLEETKTCPWEECSQVFKSHKWLLNHILATHAMISWQCGKCKQTFPAKNSDLAKQHVQTCLSEPLSSSDGKLDSIIAQYKHTQFRYDAGQKCNIFGFVRSTTMEGVTSANVQMILGFVRGCPYLCVEAVQDIPKGTELLSDYDDMNLHRLLRATVWAQASQSHAEHVHRCALETLYDIYDLPRPEIGPLKPIRDIPKILWLNYMDRYSRTLIDFQFAVLSRREESCELSKDVLYPVTAAETAFAQSHCNIISHTDVSAEAKVLLQIGMDDRPPRWQDIFVEKANALAAHDLLYEKNCPGIVIKRIDDLLHPVRFLSPPGKPQYGVFATSSFQANSPILSYKGEVISQREYDADSGRQYSFDFGLSLSLHIDACENGNEGRFVNDCFGRVWEPGRQDSEAANANYTVCWDFGYNMPVLFIVAGPKGVSKGEEVVVDYGKLFWNPLLHEMGRAHARFYCITSQINSILEEDLRSKGVRVPRYKTWPEVLSRPEGQVYRPLPMSAPSYESFEEIALQSEEEYVEVGVEQIVDKQVTPYGVLYLVKWENFDVTRNSWLHAQDLSPEMIDAYEMLQSEERKRPKRLGRK